MNRVTRPAALRDCLAIWPLLLALSALPASAVRADAMTLPPFEAVYEVSVKGVPLGRLTQRLERQTPETWHFSSTLESTGLARLLSKLHAEESSVGSLIDNQLRPARYTYFRRSGRKEKSFGLDFDWEAGRVARTDVPDEGTALEAGTLDKLSLVLGVMLDLAREVPELSHPVADKDGIKRYTLTREPAEPIDFNGRSQSVIKVSYSRGDSGRKTSLWCAPALHFQPLRIEYRERDGEITVGRLILLTTGPSGSKAPAR